MKLLELKWRGHTGRVYSEGMPPDSDNRNGRKKEKAKTTEMMD
jgi:hypothetical protein